MIDDLMDRAPKITWLYRKLAAMFAASHAAKSNVGPLCYYPTRVYEVDADVPETAGRRSPSAVKQRLTEQLALVLSDYHDFRQALLNSKIGRAVVIGNNSPSADSLRSELKGIFGTWQEAREVGKKAIKMRWEQCIPELRDHLPQKMIRRLIMNRDFETIKAYLNDWNPRTQKLGRALKLCAFRDEGDIALAKELRRKNREGTSFDGERFPNKMEKLAFGETDRLQSNFYPEDPSHRTPFHEKALVAFLARIQPGYIWDDTTYIGPLPNTVEFFDALILLGKLHRGETVKTTASIVHRLFTEIIKFPNVPDYDTGGIKVARSLISDTWEELVGKSETKEIWSQIECGVTEITITPTPVNRDRLVLS